MGKDFREDTWQSFNEKACGKKIYIWGAGYKGKEIVENVKKFNSTWDIAGFIDSNPQMEHFGTGYDVYNPEYVRNLSNEDIILISTDRPGLVAKQLDELQFSNYYSYFWLNNKMKDFCLWENIEENKLNAVRDLLSDEYSKEVWDVVCYKRKNGILDYTDIQECGDEYFEHDFFTYTNQEVFIDGGAYDGDTIEEFFTFTRNKFKKIYSFEPDANSCEIIKSKLWRYGDKVELYPYGLYDKRTRLAFKNDNKVYSSHIVEKQEATSYIECISLDEVVGDEKVSFVKMDIEGAEMKALDGARNTIINNKPKLAICIYHKPNDLWEIPLKIHEMVPEYKLYIRHYGVRYYGTILFAVI